MSKEKERARGSGAGRGGCPALRRARPTHILPPSSLALSVTTAAPTHTSTKTPAKTRLCCPDGARALVMMDSTRHSSSGPHRSQSRSSFSVSASAPSGTSTVLSFLPTRRRSRMKVAMMGSLSVYSASPLPSESTLLAGSATGTVICPSTWGAPAAAADADMAPQSQGGAGSSERFLSLPNMITSRRFSRRPLLSAFCAPARPGERLPWPFFSSMTAIPLALRLRAGSATRCAWRASCCCSLAATTRAAASAQCTSWTR